MGGISISNQSFWSFERDNFGGGKIFWCYYYLQQLHRKENGLQFSRVGTSRLSYRKEQSCNVTCISLFQHYYNRFFSNDINELIPEDHVFLCDTRICRRNYVVEWSVDRAITYGQNSFFSCIIRMWSSTVQSSCRHSNFLDLKEWKKNKIQKSHHKYLQIS